MRYFWVSFKLWADAQCALYLLRARNRSVCSSNFDLSNGCAPCSHSLCAIVLRRFFKSDRPTRSGAVQGRVALGTAFLLLAFLCASYGKEKRLKSLGIKRQFAFVTLFSLAVQPQRKKLGKKEMAIRLRGGRCYAQGATFKKVDKTIDLVRCEHTAKSQFNKQKRTLASPFLL